MTDAQMTFMEHLNELRSRVTKAAAAILIGAGVAFAFRESLFALLASPYNDVIGPGEKLVFLNPTGAFALFMKLALWGGLILASPVVIYQLWRFIAPALTDRERKYLIPASGVLALLFVGGVIAGYWSLDRGLSFLLDFGGDQIDPVIEAQNYMTFAMRFLLAFGAAFEFPVFLFGAAVINVVDSKKLREGRRWAVLIIVIAAAVITPSGDPITLLLLSGPLYVLYELTILAVRFILRK